MSEFNGCAFNYTGSKARSLSEIYKILPKEDNISCLDLFMGGGSLATQLPETWEITANDIESKLVEMHTALQGVLAFRSPAFIVESIKKFCHSYVGKTKDKTGYIRLVEDYNEDQTPLRLYALLCSSFSNQLRWNSSGKWNLPWGNRYFNPNMEKKLLAYLENLVKRDVTFTSKDFREFDFTQYDLVISDSPYLKSVGSYNENGGWSFTDSVQLLGKLDKYAEQGGKFILFEELYSNGKSNQLLLDWVSKYNIKQLGDNSDKCNYHRKGGRTQEVIVYNF